MGGSSGSGGPSGKTAPPPLPPPGQRGETGSRGPASKKAPPPPLPPPGQRGEPYWFAKWVDGGLQIKRQTSGPAGQVHCEAMVISEGQLNWLMSRDGQGVLAALGRDDALPELPVGPPPAAGAALGSAEPPVKRAPVAQRVGVPGPRPAVPYATPAKPPPLGFERVTVSAEMVVDAYGVPVLANLTARVPAKAPPAALGAAVAGTGGPMPPPPRLERPAAGLPPPPGAAAGTEQNGKGEADRTGSQMERGEVTAKAKGRGRGEGAAAAKAAGEE